MRAESCTEKSKFVAPLFSPRSCGGNGGIFLIKISMGDHVG